MMLIFWVALLSPRIGQVFQNVNPWATDSTPSLSVIDSGQNQRRRITFNRRRQTDVVNLPMLG